VRQGFELVSLSGQRRILSHVTFQGPHRVGKYGVDVNGFEEFLEALPAPDSRCPVFIIDEIGKMETFSARFCRMVEDIFTSSIPCIATIAEKGNEWIETIKLRNDVEMTALTIKNRPVLSGRITGRMKTIANDRR
jgi:nucleoside-triphosphatase